MSVTRDYFGRKQGAILPAMAILSTLNWPVDRFHRKVSETFRTGSLFYSFHLISEPEEIQGGYNQYDRGTCDGAPEQWVRKRVVQVRKAHIGQVEFQNSHSTKQIHCSVKLDAGSAGLFTISPIVLSLVAGPIKRSGQSPTTRFLKCQSNVPNSLA
jgi:hypothetical protein